MIRRTAVLVVTAAATVLALAACGPEAPPDEPDGAVRHAAPDGSGSACSAADPCALADAVTGADGGRVVLAAGEYGDLELTAAAGGEAVTRTERVEIGPAEGAEVVLGKLTLELPATTWRGVTVTGGLYVGAGSPGTRIEDVHVEGSGVFVRADDVRILDSVVEDGESIDGIQIGGAREVVVEGTTVRGFLQGGDSDVHSDCVQLYDSAQVVLRGNYFGDCDNAALIFSPGQGEGIADVVVEANHLQGCVTGGDDCSGGTVLDLRAVADIRDVVVRNNTMLDGSVMVEELPGLVFDRNIVGYASNCDMPMTNSIVASWNTGNCDRPTALGRDGNREGEVRVRDREGGDLAPADARDAAIDPAGGEPADEGFDGEPLPPDQAGAGG